MSIKAKLQQLNDFIVVNSVKIKATKPKGDIIKTSPTLIKYELDNGMNIGIGLNHEVKSAYVEFRHNRKDWNVIDIFSINDLASFFNTLFYTFKTRGFYPASITFVGVEPRRVSIYIKILEKNFPELSIENTNSGIFTKLLITQK